MLPYPVIFVPGITASTLRDIYPLPPEYVWTVLKKKYERIALHPADMRYEIRQPALVKPDQVFELAYEEMIEELRDELKYSGNNNDVPVYPFGYDWRQPLETAQQRLADFIREVIDRTTLMPHYRKAYGDKLKVNLVGHSMGGLVIARCLTDQPPGLPVNRIVTLATPFQGSFEAIVKLTVGTGNLGKGKPGHAERRAARVTPALYQLLPGFRAGISIDAAFPQTLFRPDTWQPSVIDSIGDYCREAGMPASQAKTDAAALFGKLLKLSRDHHRKIRKLDLAAHNLKLEDWLVIAGVDSDTRVKQRVIRDRVNSRLPAFEFDHRQDVLNRWDDHAPPPDWRDTGDGTVPFAGAVPPFMPMENMVLISPEDYGFWELADKGLTKLGGFHGILPNMNLVHRLVLRFLTDAGDRYGNTWGRAAPGEGAWNPPIRNLKRRN